MKKILLLLTVFLLFTQLYAAPKKTTPAVKTTKKINTVKAFYRPPLTNLTLLQKAEIWNESGAKYFQKIAKTAVSPKDDVINITDPKGLKVGGLQPKQVRVLILNGQLQGMDFYFANKGDAEASENLKRQMRLQEESLKKRLIASFGQPQKSDSGVGKTRTVNARRWNDRNRVLLLKCVPGEYLVLHILSRMEYDRQSSRKASRTSATQADLAANVCDNQNGDVYIDNVPMVDQGAKGYCVPATMERVLGYYKVPNVSMHRLADLSKSDSKKGTTIAVLKKNLLPITNQVGLKMLVKKLTINSIKQSIDKGHLLMISLYSSAEYLSRMEKMTQLHKEIPLSVVRLKNTKKLSRVHRTVEGPHVCLIIGYNAVAKEVAVSNSWGERYAMTWVRLTDLQSVAIDGTMISIEPK